MSRLWMEESDGERWLINPALVVANPRKKRRGKKMAYRRRRARRNRMPAGLARYWSKHRRKARHNRVHRRRRRHVMANPRRRRRARRNYASAGMVAMNPRRRRRHARRNRVMRRHRARRNPSLLGFTLPPTMDIVGVGTGLIVPPMLANYVFNNFVAGTSLGTSKWAYLGVEALSVAAIGIGVRRFVNVHVGNMVILGGAARVVIDAIQTLAPTLLPSVATPTGLSGFGAQPFLGYYEKRPRMADPGLGKYFYSGSRGSGSGRMIQGVPDRLDPGARF